MLDSPERRAIFSSQRSIWQPEKSPTERFLLSELKASEASVPGAKRRHARSVMAKTLQNFIDAVTGHLGNRSGGMIGTQSMADSITSSVNIGFS